MKIIFPAFWIPSGGFVTLIVLFSRDADVSAKLTLPCMFVVGSAFIYWSGIRLKEVSIDNDFLYVSNYLKEVSIPLSQIYDVTENRWVNIHPVTIHLNSPSEFGDKITFMPRTRFFALYSSHPVVNELKALARPKRMAAPSIR